MTQDEIIEMAREACFDPHDMSSDFTCNLENINAFAKLVAAKEREECAKVCDDELKEWGIFDSDLGDISKAIRARGQE